MDVSMFEVKAEQVRKAKERVVEAEKSYEASIHECDAARAAEREAYRDFMKFVCQRRSKTRPLGGAKVGHLAAHSGNVGRA